MVGWQGSRETGRQGGRVADRQEERVVGWQGDRKEGCRVVGRQEDMVVGRQEDRVVGRQEDRVAGRQEDRVVRRQERMMTKSREEIQYILYVYCTVLYIVLYLYGAVYSKVEFGIFLDRSEQVKKSKSKILARARASRIKVFIFQKIPRAQILIFFL